jgi:MFS superfamily sulfate permease-like transporter
VDFISATVLAGFVSACSVSVISGQIPGLLGMRGGGDNFIEYWVSIFSNIHDIKLWDTALGIACIVILSILQVMFQIKFYNNIIYSLYYAVESLDAIYYAAYSENYLLIFNIKVNVIINKIK